MAAVPADMEKMSTPERIDKMMAIKAERDAEITKRMNASKTFYGALTPAQQKVFDTHTQKFLKRHWLSSNKCVENSRITTELSTDF